MKNAPLTRFSPARQAGLPLVLILGLGLAACGGEEVETPAPAAPAGGAAEPAPEPQAAAAPAAPENCAAESGIDYICGPRNAEDIVRIGDTRWLLASGMNGELTGGDYSGRIHLIDSEARSYQVLFPGEEPQIQPDAALFAGCPGPLDVNDFSAHGLAIAPMEAPDTYRLYMTSHGAREAIEAFTVDASGETPSLTWTGCVLLPETTWANSVAILPDAGFYATQFFEAGSTIEPVLAGEITGHVFEWHPGGEVMVVEGTELSGANGIAVGDSPEDLWVAAFGSSEVVRFDLSSQPPSRQSVAVAGITPDNLRWGDDGRLYVAGGSTEDCGQPACGWAVMAIDPATMQAERIGGAGPEAALQGAATALPVDGELWIGTYGGDRVGIMQ